MSIFICEKCGKLDNTACNNNYWHAVGNKYRESQGEELDIFYKPQFSYFENHVCCSDCCEGVLYSDDSGTLHNGSIDIKNKEHWTKYGKEKLLELEKRHYGFIVNATDFFASHENEIVDDSNQ